MQIGLTSLLRSLCWQQDPFAAGSTALLQHGHRSRSTERRYARLFPVGGNSILQFRLCPSSQHVADGHTLQQLRLCLLLSYCLKASEEICGAVLVLIIPSNTL